jgi:two-component system, NarL family, sensor histidine kinase UhpB
MSLKLRLNLIITALLALVFIAGVALNITNARQNVRAEVESTEKLILYLFDTETSAESKQLFQAKGGLRLQRLQHMRHVRVELYDAQHQLRDSNRLNDSQEQHLAPNWFRNLLDAFSPPWQPVHRDIRQGEILMGELVITPDPAYEYAEIWKQMTDLLLLLLLFFVAINLMIFWALGKALEPTLRIWQTLNAIEGGDMQARLPTFKLPEIDRIGTKFNHMVETLDQSIRRNHQLSQQLINLQESERKSLARDLHDEFAQSLTAIHADSTVVLKLSEKKYPEILESAKAISQLSRHLMEMIGGLLQRLRPGALDELGLEAALQELITNWQTRNGNIGCDCLIQQVPNDLPEELAVTIYRLVQECLTNVTRHAKASNVHINLVGDSNKNELALSIQDDGAGIVEQSAKGFGLLGMRERVEGLGGRFEVRSDPGLSKGTEILAKLPMWQGVK